MSGANDPVPVRGPWRMAWLWAAVWLVFLVQPAIEALHRPHTWQRVAGLTGLALFSATYVLSFVRLRYRIRTHGTRLRLVYAWLAVILMITAAAVTIAALGQGALGAFVYVAVLAVFMLPTVQATVVTVLCALTPVVLPRFRHGWHVDYQLAFQIFVAGMAVYGVVQVIQRNGQLAAAREEIARLAVADERNRFARDMHDLLGHSLTVVSVKAELASRLVRLDPDRAEAEIADVQRLAREALADVRSAVTGIREGSLAGELASARTALDAAGIEADLPGAIDEVPAERRDLFGWAVREGVTNVVRHSEAARCRVRVSAREVAISDDGAGPAESYDGVGHGIAGLRERAAAAGGTVSVGRSAEGGFELRVRVS